MSLIGVDPQPFLNTSAQKPSTSRAKKRKVARNNNYDYNIPVSNNFDVISVNSDDEDEDETDIVATTQKTAKKFLPPPIVVYSYIQNHVNSLNEIKKKLTDDILVKYRGNRIILQTKNNSDYSKLKDIIQQAKLEFHTYTPTENKDHKLVIKNLPPTITTDEIKSDLTTKNILVKSVSQMSKKNSENKVIPLPLFIVTIDNKTAFKDIINTKIVCYCLISWERYRSKNGITQCYKCQAFDHIAINCYKTQKCLICAGPHNKNDCPVKEKDNFKCANCDKKHLANDKTCERYINRLAKRSSDSLPRQLTNEFTIHHRDFPHLHPTTSVAEPQQPIIWPNARTTNTNNEQSSFSELIPMVKSLFNNLNISNIIQKIKVALIKLAAAPDSASKLCVLLEIVMDIFG